MKANPPSPLLTSEFMDKYLPALLLGLSVAAIWGYFSDLQNGQVGRFIGRLVFTPLIAVGVLRVFAAKGSPDRDEHSAFDVRRSAYLKSGAAAGGEARAPQRPLQIDGMA